MKFIAKKDTLLDAARTVGKIVSASKSIPEIGGILVSADADRQELQLTGTDIRTHVQRRLTEEHVEISGEAVIPAALLIDILTRLGGENVLFEMDGQILNIRCEAAQFWIPTLAPAAFPRCVVPFPGDTIKVVGLNPLVRRTVYATSEGEDRPIMQGVRLIFSGGTTRAVASDGYRMTVAESPHCADGELEMVIHKKALTVLSSIIKPDDDLYVGIVDKSAVLFKQDLIFSTLLLTGQFMDIQQVFSSLQPKYRAKVDAKAFYSALDAASGCLGPEDDQCVNLVIGNNIVRLSSAAWGTSSKTHVEAFDTLPTPETGFSYRPSLLLDYLRRVSGPLELTFDERGFLSMDANQCKYATSPRRPVNIKKPEPKKSKEEKTEAGKKSTKPKKTKKAADKAAA